MRQNSEIVLNVWFNRRRASLFFLPLPPLLLVGFYDAEISRRPPFKYRRETFSAPSRISRAVSDSRKESERERERESRHDDHRDEIYYMFPT